MSNKPEESFSSVSGKVPEYTACYLGVAAIAGYDDGQVALICKDIKTLERMYLRLTGRDLNAELVQGVGVFSKKAVETSPWRVKSIFNRSKNQGETP